MKTTCVLRITFNSFFLLIITFWITVDISDGSSWLETIALANTAPCIDFARSICLTHVFFRYRLLAEGAAFGCYISFTSKRYETVRMETPKQ